MSDDAARRAASTRRRRRGDASPRRLRPRRVIRTWRARARADRVGVREGGREGGRDDAPGSRTALGPSRRASSPRRWREGTCRRRRCRLRRRRRLGDRRSGRRLRRGDRRSGRHLPAGHRTRLCRSPRLGPSRSPGRRHFGSRRRGRGLGPTRGRSPSRCRRRRAGEGGGKACGVVWLLGACVTGVRCGRVSRRVARSVRVIGEKGAFDCRRTGRTSVRLPQRVRQKDMKMHVSFFALSLG
jgi:hypothetical protein